MRTKIVFNVQTGERTEEPFTQLEEVEADAALAAETAAKNTPEALRASVDEVEAGAAKLDNRVQAFLNFSPEDLEQWIADNITAAANLAQLKAATATALTVWGKLAQHGARGRRLR